MSIQGKTIVFTGKISRPRHEFQQLVEQHGGIAGADVSSKTDYLVVGEKPGSKLVRASMLGVKTISEQEFIALLEEEPKQVTPQSKEKFSSCGTTNGRHYWFRKALRDNGDIVEDCLCGTIKITHPNGGWEKHEPRHIIEEAMRQARLHAIQEERLIDEEKSRKEKEAYEIFEKLTPSQIALLKEQLSETH